MSGSFEGVDLEGIKTELQQFLTQTKPVNQSSGNQRLLTGPGCASRESRTIRLGSRCVKMS
jgi:hypothetical protein